MRIWMWTDSNTSRSLQVGFINFKFWICEFNDRSRFKSIWSCLSFAFSSWFVRSRVRVKFWWWFDVAQLNHFKRKKKLTKTLDRCSEVRSTYIWNSEWIGNSQAYTQRQLMCCLLHRTQAQEKKVICCMNDSKTLLRATRAMLYMMNQRKTAGWENIEKMGSQAAARRHEGQWLGGISLGNQRNVASGGELCQCSG